MQQHVHGTDTQHGLVGIKTIKHGRIIAFTHILVRLDYSTILIINLLGSLHNESSTTHSRVANHIINLRLGHRDNHTDNVARGAELTVLAFLRHARQHILIHIAHRIGIFHIQQVDIIYHRLQYICLRNAEHRILHITTISRTTLLAYALDKHKHIVTHVVQHILSRETLEYRPAQFLVRYLLAGFGVGPLLALLKQRVFEFVSKLDSIALFTSLLVIQQLDEKQICKLFKDCNGHGYSTCP